MMRALLILLFPILSFSQSVRPQYSVDFIFEKVLEKMEKQKKPEVALPQIFFSSETALSDFQNDVREQWGFDPDVISNVYILKSNHLYLMDDAHYYEEHRRCLDDSLAHELVHFVQAKYMNIPFENFDDFMELDAIAVQTWFREKYCR